VVMNSRTATFLWVTIALAAANLGLLALGAASLGYGRLRLVGYALLAVGGVVAATLRSRRSTVGHELDLQAAAELKTAQLLIEQGDHAAAAKAASSAVARATSSRTRNAALTTLAWAALGQGYGERANAALEQIEPRHALDLYCFAAVQSAIGKPEKAIEALELARSARSLTCDGAKMLVDLYVRQVGMDRAVVAALQSRQLLGAANCRLVIKAACEAGAFGPATTLATALFGSTSAPEDAALVRALASSGR